MAPFQDIEKNQLVKESEDLQHPYFAPRSHSSSWIRRKPLESQSFLKYGRGVFTALCQRLTSRRFWFIWFGYQLCILIILAVLYAAGGISVISGSEFSIEAPSSDSPNTLHPRSWGGYHARPDSETCYRQERTAILLALFLGILGVDQWYAHHWPLAVFKLLTLGWSGVWWLVDIVLWIVGGVYGTPGCPGGMGLVDGESWRY